MPAGAPAAAVLMLAAPRCRTPTSWLPCRQRQSWLQVCALLLEHSWGMVFITHIQTCSCAQLVQRPEAQISNDLRWPVQHTALATARRDGTDAEHDGCVQLRDLQLYRRPGGEPWLLGRGSNGMVCVTCRLACHVPAVLQSSCIGSLNY